MPHPYFKPVYAWRFVLILHRLSSLEVPLRISPAAGVSIHTARMKIFQGRQYIYETHDAALARYSRLSGRCTIHTDANQLTISKSDDFDSVYADLPADSFTIIYRTLLPQLLSDTKAFTVSFSPHELSPVQVKSLRDFLANFPRTRFVQVSSTSATVAR